MKALAFAEVSDGPVELTWPRTRVALIRPNRAVRRNALSREMLRRLIACCEALREMVACELLGAVVLTGAYPAFCAGLDFSEIETAGLPDIAEVVDAITTLGVPVIGAINGAAVTGGLEVALACDFRIASDRARFADTHARVGVVPDWGLTARLPAAVGQGWARQMSATGNYINATVAERIGLVNSVVPQAELVSTALSIAQEAASVDAGVLAGIRRLYDAADTEGGQAALDGERTIWTRRGNLPTDLAARRAAVVARGREQSEST